MDKKSPILPTALAAALAGAGLAVFVRFSALVPGFTVFAHAYRPALPGLLVQAVLLATALLVLQGLYASLVARGLRLPFREVLGADAWTVLPLAFTALAPLIANRYIGAADAAVRTRLLLSGALALVLYLKFAGYLALRRNAPARPTRTGPHLARMSDGKKLGALFVASLLAFNLGAAFMLGRGMTFSGDEPHYLLMTHSLLHDGDLDLANNYRQRDYNVYRGRAVTIPQLHVVRGRRPGSEYSFHSPGTAFVMLPFYAAGSLLGRAGIVLLVKFGMSLFGALFVLQVFLFARDAWKDERFALALSALVALATPVYFYAIHVYPELIVGAMAFLVFRLFRAPDRLTGRRLLLCGALVSTFIWFHALKYIFLAGPLVAYGLWIVWKKRSPARDHALLLAFPVAVTLAYLLFQKALYGSFSLSAVSWKGSLGAGETLSYVKELLTGIPFRFRWETLAGYFFDQKDGLFLYAPIYLYAALGIAEMVRRKASDLWTLLFIAAPYVLVSAFLTQRTGYAPQARPLVAVIWAMVIGIGWFLAGARGRVYSGMFVFDSVWSLGMTALLLAYPLCLYQETTMGTAETGGGIFYVLSNIYLRWTEWLPAYAKSREGPWPANGVWLGLFALFVLAYILWGSGRGRKAIPTRAHGVIAALCGVVFLYAFVLFPRTVLYAPEEAEGPSGAPMTFYSMSRVVRRPEPGTFLLPDDGRAYVFTFRSAKKLDRLGFQMGPGGTDAPVSLEFFDAPVFKGQAGAEARTFELAAPPAYPYRGGWLYFVTVRLGASNGAVTSATPFRFRLEIPAAN